jgi:hypothetical protein
MVLQAKWTLYIRNSNVSPPTDSFSQHDSFEEAKGGVRSSQGLVNSA